MTRCRRASYMLRLLVLSIVLYTGRNDAVSIVSRSAANLHGAVESVDANRICGHSITHFKGSSAALVT